jgi:OFA family oxalate/formate antiporter-like MFS transporter
MGEPTERARSFEQAGGNTGTSQSSVNVAGLRTVAGGMIIHLMFGTLYCWGNFHSYSPANLKNYDGTFTPGSKVDIVDGLPLTIVFQALFMPFAAPIIGKYGTSFVTFLGGSMASAGILLSSQCSSLPIFVFFYGVLFGGGIGIGYTAPLAAGWKHFPNAKGTVAGFVVGAFGFGGFIFNQLGSIIFNPNGLRVDPKTGLYPPEVTENFSNSMLTLSIIYFCMTCVAAPLVKTPVESGGAAAAPAPATSVADAVKTGTFWRMWLAVCLCAQGSLYVASVFKGIALKSPALQSDSFLALVAALGGMMNGISRPMWGALYDIVGFKKVMYCISLSGACLCYSVPKTVNSEAAFTIMIMVSYTVLGGSFAIAAPETQKLFGNTAVFGMIFTSFAVASLVGLKIADKVGKTFASETWSENEVTFTWLTLVYLLGFIATTCHGKPAEKGGDKPLIAGQP